MIKNVKKNIKIPKSANTERLNGIKIAPFLIKIKYEKLYEEKLQILLYL